MRLCHACKNPFSELPLENRTKFKHEDLLRLVRGSDSIMLHMLATSSGVSPRLDSHVALSVCLLGRWDEAAVAIIKAACDPERAVRALGSNLSSKVLQVDHAGIAPG